MHNGNAHSGGHDYWEPGGGMTAEEIRAAYPQLDTVKIQAALAYAADIMRPELLVPFSR